MNRIDQLFARKQERVLNIYFTAGFPELNSTLAILSSIQDGGADIAEIGMPYSDPIADGETIQQSNNVALHNGMSLAKLFEQLAPMREKVTIPVILMGYINPVLQFGVEAFCQKCSEVGVDGLILPDLPMQEYIEEYKPIFDRYGLHNIFLITPQTSKERVQHIDQNSSGFIYMVSSASITGSTSGITPQMETYFNRINDMGLKNPRLIGFGINDSATFTTASKHAQGAIIGSAFIRAIENQANPERSAIQFIKSILD